MEKPTYLTFTVSLVYPHFNEYGHPVTEARSYKASESFGYKEAVDKFYEIGCHTHGYRSQVTLIGYADDGQAFLIRTTLLGESRPDGALL